MLRVVVVFALLVNLMACSSTSDWKGVYSSETRENRSGELDVPPDLDPANVTDGLALPNIGTGGSTYLNYTNTGYTGNKVTPEIPRGIKVVRDGIDQWLEINTSAKKLWPELIAFFTQVGFEIKREDKALGVIETNWLENRISTPSNWFTKLLGRISSTGIRDKYRARLEKTKKSNVTRLFITHQGLQEHASDEINSIKIWWEARESDPELEAEMYQRFLIFRGIGKSKAINLAKLIKVRDRARIFVKDETKMLKVGEGFARTWRRVGIALDRIGLLVDDRDRSAGVYYLRISDDFRSRIKEDKSWFSGLFSGNKVKLKDRYLLSVSGENSSTVISIYETTGAKADVRFVDLLLLDLKSYLD